MYNIVERIKYHSDKFKELIEAQAGVSELHTDDYGWENYRYESPLFRLAHVERYSHMGLQVVHITCFPHKNSKAPIFGFDVVGYQNDEAQTSKISGVFIDVSPIMYEEKWHDTQWNKDRKLPVWATVFSNTFSYSSSVGLTAMKSFENTVAHTGNFLSLFHLLSCHFSSYITGDQSINTPLILDICFSSF